MIVEKIFAGWKENIASWVKEKDNEQAGSVSAGEEDRRLETFLRRFCHGESEKEAGQEENREKKSQEETLGDLPSAEG